MTTPHGQRLSTTSQPVLNGDFDHNKCYQLRRLLADDFAYNSQALLTSVPGGPGDTSGALAEIAKMWHFNLPSLQGSCC
jgi:hypothetical protein